MASNNPIINLPSTPKTTFCDYANGQFRLTDKGLSFIGKDKEGQTLSPLWICSPLHVLAKTRDTHSGAWGRLLEWKDDDGVIHQWAMPLALLQGDASDVRRELANQGLALSPNRTARDLLASYLQVFPVDTRARCVDELGWHGDVYVTAHHVIGQSNETIVFQNTNAIESALSYSGKVEDWRNSVGRLTSGNSRLMFALSTAFAPTLAALVGEDSGGFHFRGASSSGKSTALCVAASVWGNPKAYCRLWRATANGLEGLAALHNDGLLILDELSQIDPKDAGEAAYLLANGQGKTRASRAGLAKQSAKWSLFFLSAGEESLSALMARAGQRTNAGQEIRLADIEADAGQGMGIFETLHDQMSPEDMAISLKQYAGQYYGAVGKVWLEKLVINQQSIKRFITDSMQRFIDTLQASHLSGQISRVSRRFALVAAAGELATRFGLTGWEEGDALTAVKQCYITWQESFGTEGNREDRALKAQVRAFFESHGASRFDKLSYPNEDKIQNRAGFFHTDNEGFRIYMVLSEVFKNEVCKSFDYRTAIKTLLNAGWLKPAPDGKASHKPRVRGIGTPRLYVFTHNIWDEE